MLKDFSYENVQNHVIVSPQSHREYVEKKIIKIAFCVFCLLCGKMFFNIS